MGNQIVLEELRGRQEQDEHALWQPGGFHSTLKILVISGCQTLRLERHDMKYLFFFFLFCYVVLYMEAHQCVILMSWPVGCFVCSVS